MCWHVVLGWLKSIDPPSNQLKKVAPLHRCKGATQLYQVPETPQQGRDICPTSSRKQRWTTWSLCSKVGARITWKKRLERVDHMFQWMTFVGKNMFEFSLDKMFNGTRVPPKRNITTEDQSQKLLWVRWNFDLLNNAFCACLSAQGMKILDRNWSSAWPLSLMNKLVFWCSSPSSGWYSTSNPFYGAMLAALPWSKCNLCLLQMFSGSLSEAHKSSCKATWLSQASITVSECTSNELQTGYFNELHPLPVLSISFHRIWRSQCHCHSAHNKMHLSIVQAISDKFPPTSPF